MYSNSHAGPSHISAIPAPTQKVAYDAPVFQTFQERKRAKEAALRAQYDPSPVQSPQPPTPSRSPSLPAFAASPSLPRINPNPSRPLPAPAPRSPVEATLERSDTLASVRSLDRASSRPLPKPPVSVNSSRSLDRGFQARRQPSVIEEEKSPVPTINLPDDVPSFNLPDDDVPPAIVVSDLPTISVTMDPPSPVRLETDGAIICGGCGQPIIGRILNAMKQRFHPQCFACSECRENLEHVSSYEWEGKAYCHLDYHDKFANHCYHCKTPIVDPRFVTLHDDVLGQRYYHELHFFCSECGDPFLDPSKAGGNTEEETNAFTIHKGHPYCERCHLRLHKPRCKGCKQPIPDIAVNAMGAKWHKQCFQCASCAQPLSNLFFPKDGKAFCTACWESA